MHGAKKKAIAHAVRKHDQVQRMRLLKVYQSRQNKLKCPAPFRIAIIDNVIEKFGL